ncbi:response regulator [Thalassobaculum sp.]|uniref:response regulator n=1 Tax=Thalassobaculum sp. TaxID=2022740 RepID=UPI0032F02E9F
MKVLIVEDDLLLAEATADSLNAWGCEIAGMAPNIDVGLRLARQAQLHGALLDINLRGARCFPIAEVLRERGIPFIFLTGYDDRSIIPRKFQAERCLSKPVDAAELLSGMIARFRQTGE